ncbi:MAG: S41 family peptidase [Kiritimatiellae bacterium]|nr:S41 family peptidase [Kiritimatiellia bacterium]
MRARTMVLRSRRSSACNSLVLCVWLTVATLHAALPEFRDLRAVLEAHHIVTPTNALIGSMEMAIIQAADPLARLLDQAPTNSVAATNSVAMLDALPGTILVYRVSALDGHASDHIAETRTQWTNATTAGIIFDLRKTQGRNLADAEGFAGLLLGNDVPLYHIRDGAGGVMETRSTPTNAPHEKPLPPLILLIGENTRGAAEALSACLTERDGIMLIGSTTPGDAGIRESIPLPDGRFLHIATGWVTPVGRPAYQGHGVRPHLLVPNEYRHGQPWLPPESVLERRRPLSEKAKQQRVLLERVVDDPILSRAADILLGLKALDHQGRYTALNPITPKTN